MVTLKLLSANYNTSDILVLASVDCFIHFNIFMALGMTGNFQLELEHFVL